MRSNEFNELTPRLLKRLSESERRRRADKGLETFEKDNSKAVVEAMNNLLTRKPEEKGLDFER